MHRYGGFGTLATSSVYGKIREASDDKESSRKKEVDDLISKYARKKAPPPPGPPPTQPPPNLLQRDYSSSSLKYGSGMAASRENLYGGSNVGQNRDSFYGSNNLYGGASSSNLYAPRRSSQYEVPYPEPIYETQAPRQQKYLATSKSSSNLYLQPQYGGQFGEPGNTRSMGRQQKTLSMHGAPSSTGGTLGGSTGGRNNTVMETAANIIANAHHQSAMGLGTTSDWWSANQLTATYGPAPLQHDWSQKNNLWNPSANYGAPGQPTQTSTAVNPTSMGLQNQTSLPVQRIHLHYILPPFYFTFLHTPV